MARGTHAKRAGAFAGGRFIPAGAGNTIAVRSPYGVWVGSYPLARGTLQVDHQQFVAARFIPAGAGNTTLTDSQYTPTAVHPRWRGEHIQAEAGHAVGVGSSPLARGTPEG